MRRRIHRLAVPPLAAALALGSFATPALAGTPDGDRDQSFGSSAGVAFVAVGAHDMFVYDAALQSDGKLVVTGESQPPGALLAGIARLNPDGSPDTSFNGSGVLARAATFNGEDLETSPVAVAVQADGKIVVAGPANDASGDYHIFAFRFLADGRPDPAFGTNGQVIYDFEKEDLVTDLLVQPDGKIVIGGVIGGGGGAPHPDDPFLLRLKGDGSRDATFGTNGFAHLSPGINIYMEVIAWDPAGRIVMGGWAAGAGNLRDRVFARFTAAGGLDQTFGDTGVALLVEDDDQAVLAVAVQPDSRVVYGGATGSTPTVGRLTAGGDADPTFAGDGRAELGVLGAGTVRDVAIQPNGAVVGGTYLVADSSIIRLTPSGAFDPTFNGNGRIGAAFRANASIENVQLRPNGRIVATGHSRTEGQPFVISVQQVIGDKVAPFGAAMIGLPRVSLSKSRTLAWGASDDNTGVATYTVRYRSAAATSSSYGSSTTLASSTALPYGSFTGAAGRTYCFTVSAKDRAGNTSAPGSSSCMAIPVNDRSLARAGTWSSVSSSGYYLGTASRSTAGGATLKLAGADYKRLSLVATKCSGCGTVKVYLGSTLLKTISLSATSTKRRQLIPIDVSATTRSGTITIRQSSGGKPVIIEGLVVALD